MNDRVAGRERKMKDIERIFLEEAQAGSFIYGEDENGPWAMGAKRTGNLFSMEVVEEERHDGSLYYIRNLD